MTPNQDMAQTLFIFALVGLAIIVYCVYCLINHIQGTRKPLYPVALALMVLILLLYRMIELNGGIGS